MVTPSDGARTSKSRRSRHVTLSDVAAHAKVSRATASLVVRDEGTLADATRERVRRSMTELGYVYHRGAAALRASRTQSIGLIVPDLSNDFTAELSVAVETHMDGYITVIGNTLEDLTRQHAVVRSMLERQVDGMIVIPAVGDDGDVARDLRRSGVPSVIATRETPWEDLSYVGIDNVRVGRLAAEHLILHGARRIAYLGGLQEVQPRRDRVEGAQRALAMAGGALVANHAGPPSAAWGREVIARMLDAGELPDAIICHNDVVAFGVYRTLRERDLADPTRLPAVSFDDIPTAELWDPPLTTIGARGGDVGRRCAEVLLERIDAPNEPATRVLVPPTTQIRESCGCGVPVP